MLEIIDEDEQGKRIYLNNQEIASVTDFSRSNPGHHSFNWQVNNTVQEAVCVIKMLIEETKKYALPDQKDALGEFYFEKSPSGVITVGKNMIADQQRLYTLEEFVSDPFSVINSDDVSIGFSTPHFSADFVNSPTSMQKTNNPEEIAFSFGMNGQQSSGYKYIHSGTIQDRIDFAQILTNYNISDLIVKFMLWTIPITIRDKVSKEELEEKLNGLLLQYKKPVLLAGAN